MCCPMGQLRPQTGESLAKFNKSDDHGSRKIEFDKEKNVSANGETSSNRGIPCKTVQNR